MGAARHLKNDSSLTPQNIAEINSQTEKSEEARKKYAAIVKVDYISMFTIVYQVFFEGFSTKEIRKSSKRSNSNDKKVTHQPKTTIELK